MPELIQRSKRTSYLVAALAVVSAGLLGGCSDTPASGNSSTASVASVPRTATPTASGTARAPDRTTAVAAEGPLIRYDTSDAEADRLYKTYNACLRREGAPVQGDKGLSQDPETLARYATELAACASKRPESVTDREKRKDPGAYRDDLRQQVTCMKARGLDVVVIPPDGWGVTDEAAARGYVPDFRVVRQCQLKAFGG